MKLDKKKTMMVLSGLLVLQIIFLVLTNIFSAQNLKSSSIEKQLINGLKKDNIVSLEIKDSKINFTIEKKESKWFVKIGEKNLPGNESKINSYLEILEKLQSGITVFEGKGEANDEIFGFDNNKNQILTVKTSNNKDFALQIGKSGAKSGTSYLKLNNEKKVREVTSTISNETSNSPSAWAVKEIMVGVVKQENIKSCELVSNFSWFKGKYKITRELKEKTETYLIDPPLKNGLSDESILKSIFVSVGSFVVIDYKLNGGIDEKKKLGSITITSKPDKKMTLDFYKDEESENNNIALKTSFSDNLYLCSEESVKLIFRDTKDLIKK